MQRLQQYAGKLEETKNDLGFTFLLSRSSLKQLVEIKVETFFLAELAKLFLDKSSGLEIKNILVT